jgi:hypothetical protein
MLCLASRCTSTHAVQDPFAWSLELALLCVGLECPACAQLLLTSFPNIRLPLAAARNAEGLLSLSNAHSWLGLCVFVLLVSWGLNATGWRHMVGCVSHQ